jgi:acetyl/propionyl-CoA carboxylase alpha subunit
MRRVDSAGEFIAAFNAAGREARSAFGRGDCYIEKFLVDPRHVEIQILADNHGACVHLFERDCSLQRRHQKVVEETPCPILRPEVRDAMGAVACQAAEAARYEGVGTVEFLLDADQSFFFLEMNTRLQVEHPITELVTGLDLVAEQLRVALGEPLPFVQQDLSQRGASIEVRIYAEDPLNDFRPSPGTITRLQLPEGPGIRVDSGVYEGCEVPMHYDPMVLKLITWGSDRTAAIQRMERALGDLTVRGIHCTTSFLLRAVRHPDFVSGNYNIGFIERHFDALTAPSADPELLSVAELAGLAAAFERDERRAAGVATGSGGQANTRRWRDFARRKQVGG